MRRGLLAAALTASIATGCGGASGDSSARLRSQATNICTVANRRLEPLRPHGAGAGDRTFLDRGIAVLEPELRRLRRLHADSEDRPVYGNALATLGQEVAELRRAVGALDRHQDPALALAALQRRLTPLEGEANSAWRALQVPACLNG